MPTGHTKLSGVASAPCPHGLVANGPQGKRGPPQYYMSEINL